MSEERAAASAPPNNVRVPRWMFVIFELIALAVGLTPLALFLGRPKLLLYCSIAAFVMLVISMRKIDRFAAGRPSLPELLMAQIASICIPATLGVFSLGCYGLVYGVLWSVAWLAKLIGWSWGINPDAIAFYFVAAWLVLLTLGSGARVQKVVQALFPTTPGEVSDFRVLIARRPGRVKWTVMIVSLLLVASIVCFIVWRDRWPWVFIVFQLALIVTSMAAWPPSSGISVKGKRADTAEVVGTLFQILGYSVEKPQRTGQPAVDPFLADIDLVATGPQQKYLVQVNAMGGSTTSTSWRSISGLRMACLVLGEQQNATPSEALLVLLDASGNKPLLELARREQVHILELSSSETEDIRTGKAAKGDAKSLSSATMRLKALLAEPLVAAGNR
jgi:hypothetical protein